MDDFNLNFYLIRQALNRHADKLAGLDFVLAELAQRVVSRLDYIKLNPTRIVDCGTGRGLDAKLLSQKFPAAELIQLDIALELLRPQQSRVGMLSRWLKLTRSPALICADAAQLPLANASIDFCYSNMLLPYLSDLPQFIREMRRVLSVGGAFCLAGLGVDSLKEIRALGLRTFRFPDMHDIGDMLLDAGFTNPVVDTEYITLQYDQMDQALEDLKLIGAGAAHPLATQGRFKRDELKQLRDVAQSASGLTLEVFVAHGWKDRHKIELPSGHQAINFKT